LCIVYIIQHTSGNPTPRINQLVLGYLRDISGISLTQGYLRDILDISGISYAVFAVLLVSIPFASCSFLYAPDQAASSTLFHELCHGFDQRHTPLLMVIDIQRALAMELHLHP
jgi:hypothetical protein